MEILWSLGKASSKIALTFVVMVAVVMLDFFFNDAGILNFFVKQSEKLESYLSNWSIVEGGRGEWVWKTFTDDSVIVGILLTLFARVVLEVFLWAVGAIWTGLRKEDEVDIAEAKAGVRDAGYYEA